MSESLQVSRTTVQGADYIEVVGTIDQIFSAALLGELSRPTVLDLRGVDLITFYGVRRWCETLREVPRSLLLFLAAVPSCMVDQLLQVPSFAGHARLLSLLSPEPCPGCGSNAVLTDLTLTVPRDACERCGWTRPVGNPEVLALGARYGARQVPAAVLALLGHEKPSRRPAAPRPLNCEKVIEDRFTFVRMMGGLDPKRARRLLFGVEGHVIIDAAELTIPEQQMDGWLKLLVWLSDSCSSLVIVKLPYQALHATTELEGRLPELVVFSVILLAYCQTCDELRRSQIEVSRLADIAPAGPRLSCVQCGHTTQIVSGLVPRSANVGGARSLDAESRAAVARMESAFTTAALEANVESGRKGIAAAEVERIGPYRILRRLGSGGMAEIFLATPLHGNFTKPVAIKLFRTNLPRSTFDMFLQEARVNARLSHPNIVQVFDIGEADGNLYIVMEYLDGINLQRLLRTHRAPLPLEVTLAISLQVLAALEYAHSASDPQGKPLRLVHRDVSPANIVVSMSGHATLIDFGVAINAGTAAVAAGNPPYMSPEQFNAQPIDLRSDLFSLGAVMYEMLSGKALFDGGTILETASRVTIGAVPPIPQLPAPLFEILKKMLSVNPERRFTNARQLADALQRFGTEHGLICRPSAIESWLDSAFVQERGRLRSRQAEPAQAGAPPVAAEAEAQLPLPAADVPAPTKPPTRSWGFAQGILLMCVVAVVVWSVVMLLYNVLR
jgi:serine/threonine protein kinase